MLLPLFAAFAPFILWLVEVFLPYPHIVEELAKAIFIYPTVKYKSTSQRIVSGVIFGCILF